jgi:Bacterial cadherin-like domain
MGRPMHGRLRMLPLGRLTAESRRGVLVSVAVAASAWLAVPANAVAVPMCPDQEVTAPIGTPVTITLACTESDPSLLPISYSIPPGTVGVSISGDKATFTPGTVGGGFHYLASNNIGQSAFGFVRVHLLPPPPSAPPPPPAVPPNHPPVARCDSYRVKPGATLSVPRPGVLANDSDPDGDPLRAVSHPSGSATTASPGVHSNGSIRFSAPTKRACSPTATESGTGGSRPRPR